MFKVWKSIFFLICFILVTCSKAHPQKIEPEKKEEPPFSIVYERLLKENSIKNLDKIKIDQLHYEDEAITYRLLDRARKERDFSGYYTKSSIRKVKKFISEHPKALKNAEKKIGVPKEIVASVLFLETTYSKQEGKYKALDTLFSLATLIDEGWAKAEVDRAKKIAESKPDLYPSMDKIQWEERSKTFGAKGYEELNAYFLLCEKYGMDPLKMKSSWAGAMGKGQFIPSTALRLMGEGGFSKKSLKSWTDTIRLTAMHIAQDGWNSKATEAEKFEAVRKYNGLEEYAKAVFEIQNKLK